MQICLGKKAVVYTSSTTVFILSIIYMYSTIVVWCRCDESWSYLRYYKYLIGSCNVCAFQ